MEKNEIYTAIGLVTLLLISIVWKEELNYRNSLGYLDMQNTIMDYSKEEQIKDVDSSPTLTREEWLEKYGGSLKLIPNS